MKPRNAIACAAVLISLSALSALAQMQATPQQARDTAARLLSAGQARAALEVTDVLLRHDAEDSAALILAAHAHRTLRDYDAAQQTARAAWQTSDRGVERYGAAMAMAMALSSDGHKSRAQLWLRRAAHIAPNDAMRARAVRDYRYVRGTNPWSVNLRFGLTPSDNVNNAPVDNEVIVGGLVFVNDNAVPLSGVEVTLGGDLRYNFNIQQDRRDFAMLSWDHARVHITDDDKPATVDEADFTRNRLAFRIGRDMQASGTAPRRTVSADIARTWSGGDPLSDDISISYGQTHRVRQRAVLQWYGTLGYSDRHDNVLRSGTFARVGATMRLPVAKASALTLSAQISRSDTDSRQVSHNALHVGATYTFGTQVLGAQASVSAHGTLRRYDSPVYGPDARADDGITLSTSFLFKDFDTYGFAPKVTVSARRNNSNVSQFETRSLGVSIGFQSLF